MSEPAPTAPQPSQTTAAGTSAPPNAPAGLSPEQIANLQTTLERVQERLDGLSGKVGGLESRLPKPAAKPESKPGAGNEFAEYRAQMQAKAKRNAVNMALRDFGAVDPGMAAKVILADHAEKISVDEKTDEAVVSEGETVQPLGEFVQGWLKGAGKVFLPAPGSTDSLGLRARSVDRPAVSQLLAMPIAELQKDPAALNYLRTTHPDVYRAKCAEIRRSLSK